MAKLKSLKFKEIRQLIERATVENGESIAYKEKINGQLASYSYNRLKEDIWALGTALLKRGYKNKHISIIGENSYRWLVSYLAILGGVGVAVPLDKELYEEQISDLINKGDVSAIFFSETFLCDMEDIKKKSPKLNGCICINTNDEGYLSLNDLIEEGKEYIKKGDTSYDDVEVNPEAMSVIMFTSGTTGANKGVMISQTNLLANTEVASDLFKGYKRIISVLPFHHAYENVCAIFTAINIGATVFINDSLKYLTKNMQEFKPELATMVPVFLETMNKSIEVQIQKKRVGKLVKFATWWSNLLYKIGIDIRSLMFMEIHKNFGGSFKTIVCGGAVLRPELVSNFRSWGIRVINGYGISECTPLVSVNMGEINNDHTVGQIVDSCDVNIDYPNEEGIGEILVKGKNVMLGYYKDKESTRKSFKNGWFKTGDYGYLKGSSLYLTGRKKNLIILSNGKNVHPEELEGYIYKEIPYVQEALVYVDTNKKGSDMIVATVYLDKEYIEKNCITDIPTIVKSDLRRLNRKLPGYKQIQNIYIKDEEFEKNSSRKIMRYKFLEEVKSVGV